MVCAQHGPENCICTLAGSNHMVDCSQLTSRCLMTKAEMILCKEKRFWGHPHGLLSNDGIYNTVWKDTGIFKAGSAVIPMLADVWAMLESEELKRVMKTSVVVNWLEQTGSILSWSTKQVQGLWWSWCSECLETSVWEPIQTAPQVHHTACNNVYPVIQIRLNQHEKSRCDVDTADVVYYFEKDTKHDSIFHSNSTWTVCVNGDALDVEELQIYYVDEKPLEFCMQQLGPGFGGVMTVLLLAAGTGITVLALLRWLKTRKYEQGD